ncbi:MAG: hypothetical protein ACREL9_09735 [Gemmatimonadales bacterium]
MKRAAGLVATAALITAWPPARLAAQRVAVGPQLVIGDYREVSADLRYQGTGVGAAATVRWKKFSADVAYASVSFSASNESASREDFTAKQFDARVRYAVRGPVSVEAGVTNRTMDPEFAAQSMGAGRIGARMSTAIGSAVQLGFRGNLLLGAKFSGGGEAPVGIELGLAITGDFNNRFRIGAEYEFQRVDRTTATGPSGSSVDVPIQQSLLRLGAGLIF